MNNERFCINCVHCEDFEEEFYVCEINGSCVCGRGVCDSFCHYPEIIVS